MDQNFISLGFILSAETLAKAETEQGFFASLTLWHYLIIGLGIISTAFGLWVLFKRMKLKSSKKGKGSIPRKNTHQSEDTKNTLFQSPNLSTNEGISKQIRQLETRLIQEIHSTVSRGDQLSHLNNEISNLKNENNRLRNEKDSLEGTVDSIKIESRQISLELNQLNEKVINVDYLQGYCDSALTYFKLGGEVALNAYEYFNVISKQNIHQTIEVVHLLMNFQYAINSLPLGNWIQILHDIRDTGLTNHQKIKNCFKQLNNNEDKKLEFERLLISEVLAKYSSNILILAEAFRNIGRFQDELELSNDAQIAFGKHVNDLINKVKPTGLENKYVPLFENIEEFSGYTELAKRERGLAYKGIVGVEKESIIEIVSYGVKASSEDTKTVIILA